MYYTSTDSDVHYDYFSGNQQTLLWCTNSYKLD